MEKFEPDFIKNKYWDKEEFRDASDKTAERTEIRTGEKVSQTPKDKIENYLSRFLEITEREDENEREREV